MSDTHAPMVLACIDGSKLTASVCDYAAWVSLGLDAPLKLLHNLEQPLASPVADLSGSIGLGSQEHLLAELTEVEAQRSKLLLERGKLMLEGARARVMEAGANEPKVSQRHGSLVESLIDLEDDIQVLVLGIRGKAHEDDQRHLGAQLETIVRALHRPILVVNSVFTPPQRVMLAYDGSVAAQKALTILATTPIFKALPCHLVYVGDNSPTHDRLLTEAETELKQAGMDVRVDRLEGKGEEVLCRYRDEHNIDLTVMGAYSHTRLRELLLGSFTTKMLVNMEKPLLLLR